MAKAKRTPAPPEESNRPRQTTSVGAETAKAILTVSPALTAVGLRVKLGAGASPANARDDAHSDSSTIRDIARTTVSMKDVSKTDGETQEV